MVEEIVAVTALYDVGRAEHGRAIDRYIDWLNATLRLPIRFIVFLDPALEAGRIHLKSSDRLVRTPLGDYRPFSWRKDVERISTNSKSSDITFKIPNYAMLVMSKFDMLARVASEEGSEQRLLWIDAGLSRFFKNDLTKGALSIKHLKRFDSADFAASITPDCAKALRQKRVESFIGTSQRMVSGGDMYMTGAGAMDAADRLYDLVETEWLPRQLWDNEQVAMGCLLAKGWPGFYPTRTTSEYAAVVSALFNLRRHRSGLLGGVDRLASRFTGAALYQG